MSLGGFLNSKQNTITGAAVILTVAVLLSRILGLLRDRLLAGAFGASTSLDVYFAAFRIPDLVYSIIFAGGVIVSLLPLFSDLQKSDEKKSWDVINNILNIFIVCFFVFSALFFAFTPQIISSMVSGFDPVAKEMTVSLSRLIFISVFFFGLSSVFSTVLNYFNRFVSYSLAPILYNLGIIFGIVVLSPHWGVFGAGMGVVLGSLMHFLIQLPSAVKCGYKYRAFIDLKSRELADFFGLIVPRTIASSSSQINFIVITFIASGIGTGAISVFNLSNNLRYLPVGIIGVSFATAVFPFLSKLWTEQKKEEFRFNFRKVFNEVLYVSFPIGVLIFVLRNEIVNIVLRSGQFGTSAVEITAAALGLYILSTFAQCLVPVLLRGFFSLKDTVTPTVVAIFFVVFNVYLSFLFVGLFSYSNFFTTAIKDVLNLDGTIAFPVLGLVMAFNIGLLMEFVLLFALFYRKVGDFGIKSIFISFLKIFFSSALMGLSAHYALPLVKNFFGDSLAGLGMQFASVCLVSFLVYWLLTVLLGIENARGVKKIILRDEN